MSTSMPIDVQSKVIASIPGLQDAEMIRPGYAIEYDAIDPRELTDSLQLKSYAVLFLAGQINGTSGYEEAACQGLMAGINAALKVKNEAPLILDRTEAYTAILIDDLISKGTNEPYRMFTSRAEFRLHLRIDNADRRLTPHGRRVGLINDAAWSDHLAKQERMKSLTECLEKTRVDAPMLEKLTSAMTARTTEVIPTERVEDERAEASAFPETRNSKPETLPSAIGNTLAQLLKRPDVTIEHLRPILTEAGHWPLNTEHLEMKSVETEIKYAGYLQQQQRSIERLKKAEQRNIPEWFDYKNVSGLSREMHEKLTRVRPRTIAQASRIPGVTPAALSLINVYIDIQARRHKPPSDPAFHR